MDGTELDHHLRAARILGRRLRDSADELRTLMPVTGTALAYMPEKFRTEADALLHRFRTLHGLLMGRILPGILERAGLECRGKSPREIPDLLVGIGLAPNPAVIDGLQRPADRLNGDFPTDPGAEAELLNETWRHIGDMIALLDRAESWAGARNGT